MKITLLLGNGFDLQNGFDTSYYSFYEHLKRIPDILTTKNTLILDIISKEKQKKVNWSDLESALATSTKDHFFHNNYLDNLMELTLLLQNYILEVVKSQEYEHLDFEDLLLYGVEEIINEVNRSGTNQFFENFDCLFDNSLSIDVHSLNYTSFAQVITNSFIDRHRIDMSNVSHFNYNIHDGYNVEFLNTMRSIDVESCGFNYLHGEIESTIYLGTSNSQSIDENCIHLHDISKQHLLEANGIISLEKLKNSLLNTNLIIVYGCSLGESDMHIKKMIIDALNDDPNKKIIIVDYHSRIIAPQKRKKLTRKYSEYPNKFVLFHDGLLNLKQKHIERQKQVQTNEDDLPF